MKLVLLSDVHLMVTNPRGRKDDMVSVQWRKLRHVFEYAKKHNAPILQAGDFTDMPRSWFLLILLMAFLREYPTVKVFSVFGQHDTYLYSEESRNATILGALHNAGLLTVLSEKPVVLDGGKVALYGASYGMEVPRPKKKSRTNILVTHDNISDRGLYESHKYSRAKKYLRSHKRYDLILCGDIHRKFQLSDGPNRTIVNTGPLLRTTTAEHIRRHKPCFGVYKTSTGIVSVKNVPHEDVKNVLSKSVENTEKQRQRSLSTFLEKVEEYKSAASTASKSKFKENIDLLLKKTKASREIREALTKIMET